MKVAKCLLMLIFAIPLFTFFPVFGVTAPIEKYADKTIEVIVPYAPGGPNDIAARVIAEKLAKILKVPVVIVNKAGAGGILGTSFVARAKKDGYTLLCTNAAPIVSVPVIDSQNVNYDVIKDFEPLGRFVYIPVVILVRSDSPYRSFEELADFVKKHPEKLNCGIPQIGLGPHLVLETLRSLGLNMTMVVTKGVPENISFLMGGHVDVTVDSLSSNAGHIRDGKFRPLAIVLEKRFQDFPNIPTLAEKGFPQATLLFWAGFFAPAGISQDVKNVLVPAIKQASVDPETVEKLRKLVFFTEYAGPEDFRKEIPKMMEIIRDVATKAGMIKDLKK